MADMDKSSFYYCQIQVSSLFSVFRVRSQVACNPLSSLRSGNSIIVSPFSIFIYIHKFIFYMDHKM